MNPFGLVPSWSGHWSSSQVLSYAWGHRPQGQAFNLCAPVGRLPKSLVSARRVPAEIPGTIRHRFSGQALLLTPPWASGRCVSASAYGPRAFRMAVTYLRRCGREGAGSTWVPSNTGADSSPAAASMCETVRSWPENASGQDERKLFRRKQPFARRHVL